MASPLYIPEKEELTDAVVGYISELPEGEAIPSTKVIITAIEEQNPTWKVHERKTARIVRRYTRSLNKKESGKVIVDDLSVSSSASSIAKAKKALKDVGSKIKSTITGKPATKTLLPEPEPEPEPEEDPYLFTSAKAVAFEDEKVEEKVEDKPCFNICVIS